VEHHGHVGEAVDLRAWAMRPESRVVVQASSWPGMGPSGDAAALACGTTHAAQLTEVVQDDFDDDAGCLY
jgi:hypothetical protein